MPRILIDEALAVRCACVREGARRAQLTAPTEGVAMPSDAVVEGSGFFGPFVLRGLF